MLNSTSVKTRFFASVGGNVTRAAISFAAGLIVARGLSPSGYGKLMFLLGSFTSFKALMDMGTSSAFYTFISQRPRNRKFYLTYLGWLAFQFLGTSLLIVFLLPQAVITKVWLGESRTVILLAFAASFFQQQIWQTLGQIGDASRKTVKIQIMNLAVGAVHLIAVYLMLVIKWLTVNDVLWLFIIEYVVVSIWGYWFLKDHDDAPTNETGEDLNLKQVAQDYWKYCKPLILLSLVSFLYDFADRWMLQRFGGSNQQGFYQISNQFASISLLATTSILRVFWKEVAEAGARQDNERVVGLYQKVTRGLVMFSAILSGFLIPWSKEIVTVSLGKEYVAAWPVLALMFLYPIHQSLGQIVGTMFLAKGQTKVYSLLSMVLALVSIPVSYLAQAPPSNPFVPGFGLGAMGMALKMVLLNIVSVNASVLALARINKWKFDWAYQVVGITFVITMGYLAKRLVSVFWNVEGIAQINEFLLPGFFSGIIYIVAVFALILAMPWIAGIKREDISGLLLKKKRLNEQG